MKLNTELYQALRGGLTVTSPATAEIATAQSNLSRAKAALSGLPGGIGDSYLVPLDSAQSQLSATNSHINSQKNGLLTQLSQSELVNRLDATVDKAPPGCVNSVLGTGILTGEDNALYQAIATGAADISKSVADYLAGVLELSGLQTALDKANSTVSSSTLAVAGSLAKETAHLNEMKAKVRAMSQAQALEGLWRNPCSKAVLDPLLGDDLKELLP